MKIQKIITATLIGAVMSVSLAACQNTTGSPGIGGTGITKENIGLLGGAAAGAWAGSNVGKGKGNIVGIAAGTLLGAALGKSIGASLDKADMAYYDRTSQSALETATTGKTVAWKNPDSGNEGTITPTRTYQQADTFCREYQQSITVGGRTQQSFGTACRQPDGSWKIVN